MQLSVIFISPIYSIVWGYLQPKNLFDVTHPGLTIEHDFPLHGLTCTENPGIEIPSKYLLSNYTL